MGLPQTSISHTVCPNILLVVVKCVQTQRNENCEMFFYGTHVSHHHLSAAHYHITQQIKNKKYINI